MCLICSSQDELTRLRSDNRELSRLLAEALARETVEKRTTFDELVRHAGPLPVSAMASAESPPEKPSVDELLRRRLTAAVLDGGQDTELADAQYWTRESLLPALVRHHLTLADAAELEALLWFHAEVRQFWEQGYGVIGALFHSERYKPLARAVGKET